MTGNNRLPDDGWEILFNGQNLSGWETVGSDKAKFYVDNGIIVGETQRNIPNSFLTTKKEYEDFILEVDFKVDSVLNSGVQIRSGVYEEETTTGYLSGDLTESERTWRKGVMYGYQIEIDPSKRAWSGAFYEEGGRGWLQPLTENDEARSAYKKEGWNTFRIIANDNHFQAWINGVKSTDFYDSKNRSGSIGLQLHSAGRNEAKIDKQIMFKNIRIKELP
ncbi:MAG: DUF1080 domain-containing protein [Candidatus Heimdallarchaeota archaeon]|nr:DUF1080 domain-containing protein [Candidatus Heimdallarchaeota archaeon]